MKIKLIKVLVLMLCVSFALFAVSCKKNKKESAKESTVESVVESETAPESIIESDVESGEESETESQEESESVHECDYTELKYNSTHHWYECTCGAKDSSTKQAHAGGTATCEELAVCDVCRAGYGTYGRHNMVEGECTVCGAKGSQGLEYELNADQTGYTVVGIGSCNDTDLIIPTTYQSLPVTSIGERAFYGCTSLVGLEIPDSVTSIGYEAFESCRSLTSVYYMGEIEGWCNITFGDAYANPLYNGASLHINNQLITEVVIPESITEIKDHTFYNWTWLTSVEIPDSVTSIGDQAFRDCDSLTSVVIGDGVTSIGSYAFSGCDSLTSIEVSENNTAYKSIDGNLYSKDGTKLIQYAKGKTDSEFIIPDSVTSIGDWAFYSCDSLTSVVIGDSVTSIGWQAFSDCYSLTSVVIGGSVTSIGNYAFYSCDSLTSVYYTGEIEDWCNITFSYFFANPLCYGASLYINNVLITELVIPNTVTEIKAYAFSGCGSLTSIEIPESVTSIGYSAFRDCGSLTSVYYTGVIEDWCNITFSDSSANPLYNGASLYINNVLITELVIPESITEIKAYAFSGCSSLTSVVIPDSVTSIGEQAFRYCYSLTSVEIPNSVTSIGEAAFLSCDSLTSVVIGESVTSIGDYAFSGCSNLTSVEIPDSVTSIGEEAFYGCGSLTSVEIPDSVTSIGRSAFYGCGSLTSVEIPDSVTSIGRSAFDDCYKLVEVINKSSHITVEKGSNENGLIGYYALSVSNRDESYVSKLSNDNGYIIYTDGAEKILVGYIGAETDLVLPDYITQIYQYAFYNSDSLTSVVIGESVTSIGACAFSSCDSLTSVVIPDSVTSIGAYAFYNCDSLTSVEIPDSVTSIGNSAFSNCANLTSVEIPDSVTSIGNSAFYNCDSLKSVVIPDSVTSIGNSAFYNCDSLKSVYYKGTSSEWSSISIDSFNADLTNATRYYYIENEADVPTDGGNYWHYGENGEILVW